MRVAVLCLVTLIGLWATPMALAEEQPRRGGILQVALGGRSPQPGRAPGADLYGVATDGPRLQ